MDITEARKRVQKVKEMANDPEEAHILEDQLFLDFVTSVAKTGPEPLQAIAKVVLKSKKIEFSRHAA